MKVKKIVDFIEHLECPLINGIIFPDETIQLLDIQINKGIPKKYTIQTALKTSINILNNKRELYWTSCAILFRLIYQKYSIEIIVGEAGYGSDGFIGVIDLKSRKLIWLAFFDCSNPFDKVKVIKQEIYATSTLGYVWKFKIKNPIDCSVEYNNTTK